MFTTASEYIICSAMFFLSYPIYAEFNLNEARLVTKTLPSLWSLWSVGVVLFLHVA